MLLHLPWPREQRTVMPIFPAFFPFFGCPLRCIFCAQHLQTGVDSPTFSQALAILERELQLRVSHSASAVELGFYGGTFTALPEKHFSACLELATRYRALGAVSGARCSTRPDAVDPARLKRLRDAGFHMVELGVQSFATSALQTARRGYDAATAARACALVQESGLELGIQLLPGMPGVTPEIFQKDVRQALEYGAQTLRFYPCLVIEHTELAGLWRRGEFQPWTLNATIPALAQAFLAAQARNVPVIRMGLAQEPGLEAHILAGPVHPALGSLVRGEALWQAVADVLRAHNAQGSVRQLRVPRFCQGFLWGHANALRQRWQNLGLTSKHIAYHDAEEVLVEL